MPLILSSVRVREIYVLISIAVMSALFSYINPRFASSDALYSILNLATELGIIAIGVSLLMIAGGFDLSVGSVYAFAGIITITMLNHGYSYPAAFLAAAVFAIAIGTINGVITVYGRIPSFIATLGMMWLLRGVLLAITGGFPAGVERLPPESMVMSYKLVGDLSASTIWFLAMVVILNAIMTQTALGNQLQAVGGALNVARALGVRINRVRIIAFIISSLCASIAGQVAVVRFRIIEPTAGQGIELEAIAASVLGGTLLTGGVGSIVGAALGAVLVSTIRVGLIFAGAPAYWYIGFIGALLIIVGIISLRRLME
ncbi:MAG: ABC transporter permease [Desulfurococcaceae archaeon]|nr:MAG: ABC transporter permease [Desulfurococcaceae archaeon]